MNNLSILCLLATLIAVSCYSVKQEPFDYCNDIYNETICTKDKDTNCLKGYWVHVCAKSCAYRDVFGACASDMNFFCSILEYRRFCTKTCYERDCKSKNIADENTDEERMFLNKNYKV